MKLLRFFFSLLILFLISLNSFGQGWYIVDQLYPSAQDNQIIKTLDGGVLTMTTFGIIKYNDNGLKQWENNLVYGPLAMYVMSVTQESNGNYICVGRGNSHPFTRQFYIVRLNSNGNIISQKIHDFNSGSDNVVTNSIIGIGNSNFAVAGRFDTSEVLIIDSIGNIIDSKNYYSYNFTTPLYYGGIECLHKAKNGNYVISGKKDLINDYIALLNNNLDTLWLKTIPENLNTDYKKNSITSTDSFYIVCNGSEIFYFNNSGDLVNSFSNSGTIHANDLLGVENNHVLSVKSSGLYKHNINGNILFHSNFTSIADSVDISCMLKSNNHFYFSGFEHINNSVSDLTLTIKTDTLGNIFSNQIKANLFLDVNNNCIMDSGEVLIPNIHASFTDSINSRNYISDQNGLIYIRTDDGISELKIELDSSSNYQLSCINNPISFNIGLDTIVNINIPLTPTNICPGPYVTINNNAPFRACQSSSYNILYCNLGTQNINGVYIDIEFSDLLNIDNSSIPYQSTADSNIYRFNIGQLDISECGSFSVDVSFPCRNIPRLSVCVTAEIYPDTFCLDGNSLWDMSNIEIEAECQSPDSVQFRIINDGSGNMNDPRGIIIVEDNVMYQNLIYQLGSGAQLIKNVPANGATWRLEAEQDTFHPYSNRVAKVVEGCGIGINSTNFVNIMPLNYRNPFVNTYCEEIIHSYDPNDKKGFPYGVGNQHYVRNSDPINYKIRFQNTGNDTAFYVSIRDTLSEHLKVSSVVPGASSHDYEFEVFGPGVLEWRFKNILLPDSNVNEPESHGFVEFTVDLKPNLPTGTVIENDAAIYFDFNAPIITNTTFHTVGELGKDYLVWLSAEDKAYESLQMKVYPNPSIDMVFVDLKGVANNEDLKIEIFDLSGKQVLNRNYTGDMISIPASSLDKGMYLIRVSSKEKVIANGKLIKL